MPEEMKRFEYPVLGQSLALKQFERKVQKNI